MVWVNLCIELSPEDLEVIKQGYERTEILLQSAIERIIELSLMTSTDSLKLDLICNLIAAGRLKIKVAYLSDGGIYHEKIGIFKDNVNDCVCFSGSTNETYNGYKKNVESVFVLKSWDGDFEEVENQRNYFESLWDGKDESISVMDFPDAAKAKLFSKYKKSDSYIEAIEKVENYFSEQQNASGKKELYPYQKKAIEEFLENKCCHFYEMATGTGKTFTAVKTLEAILDNKICDSLYVMVIVPQIDLGKCLQKIE